MNIDAKHVQVHALFFQELNASNLRILDLKNCDFRSIPENALNSLVNLEYLSLTRPTNCSRIKLDGLTRLQFLQLNVKSNAVPQLTNVSASLRILDISYEESIEYDVQTNIFNSSEIFRELRFPNLEELRLSLYFDEPRLIGFNLDLFPDDLLNLKLLSISCNRFKSVCLGQRVFHSLESLELSRGDRFSMLAMEHIEGDFANNFPNLLMLTLNTSEKLQFHAQIFSRLDNLKLLRICCDNVKMLAENAFVSLNQLVSLTIRPRLFKGNLFDETTFMHFQNLKSLNLSANKLRYIDPDCFARMNNLVELDLSDNLLEIDKRTFCHLSKLKKLNLADNFIGMLEDGVFSSLILLAELILANNRFSKEIISSTGWCVGLENLRKLDLSNNRLETIPFGVFSILECLESIDMRYNPGINLNCQTMQHIEEKFSHIYFDF